MPSLISIERKEPERLSTWATNGAEVPLIERQNVEAAMTLREYNHRGVGQAQVEIGVALDDGDGGGNVGGAERLKLVHAARHVVEQFQFLGPTTPCSRRVLATRCFHVEVLTCRRKSSSPTRAG